MLPLALALFAEMPSNVTCSGSPMAVAAPINTDEVAGATIRSIAEIRDRDGTLVGWVYLADVSGSPGEFVQPSDAMSADDVAKLHLQLDATGASRVAKLGNAWPAPDLHVVPCSDVEQKITD